MNDILNKVKTFVTANKSIVIRVGGALLGATLGVVVASVIDASMNSAEAELVDLTVDENEESNG